MNILERMMVSTNIAPKPLYDAIIHSLKARAILVATNMGIFDVLDGQWMTAEQIARRRDVPERSLQLLLDALVSNGYLRIAHERYTNAATPHKWLAANSPKSVGNFIRHYNDLWNIWGNLEQSVRTDLSAVNFFQYCFEHPDIQRNFVLGSCDIARFVASIITANVPVTRRPQKMLDIGGAHGYYSMAFCREYEGLTSTVIDFENVVKIGQEIVKAEGMQSTVKFRAADYTTGDFGNNYDIVLMFALFHSEPPESNIALLKKVYNALNEGGTAAITEVLSSRSGKKSEIGTLFALNMLTSTPYGQAYGYEQIRDWMDAIGYHSIKQYENGRLPGYTLITALK